MEKPPTRKLVAEDQKRVRILMGRSGRCWTQTPGLGDTDTALLDHSATDRNPPPRQWPGVGPVPSPQASEGRTLRSALVVDDELLIRWSVSETLASLGLDVEQATDGASALAAIAGATAPFDVVVLDLRLPDVDDLALVRRIRELLPSAGVVLMTAFATPEIISGAQALGVRAVLNKPFELEDLARLVSAGDDPTS
jgi:CheY-like chemotaxis protein